ncbi:hypothetical protein ILUMI_17425 [Ignelater luminosus]|uniref:Uncharacterized protein n=1 Tax=Ignelater luminosus TaxID=2038154 RepID=A0A8K0G7X7_IGNLU|nr:hypothetical protein ILUMI_17425 [Ignelater luminosus]
MTTFMIGSLRSFDETKEDINGYLLRLKHYLKVSDVESTYRVSVLLATVDLKLELTDILVNHLKPARLIIDERFKFNTRVHQQEESISEFVVALKHLAKTCNFGTFSKDSLRDRLVGGIKDSHIQQRLRAAESDFDETSKKALIAGIITISNIVSSGTVDQDVVNLKKKFKSVFDLHRRKILGHEVKLVFRDENVTSSFCKARPVPYAIKDAVEKKLKRLLNTGVLKPVTSTYDYQIVYKKGTDISNADELSRLPLPNHPELELASYCFSIKAPITAFLQNSEEIEKPITIKDVEQETEKDVVLKQIFAYVRDDWSSKHVLDLLYQAHLGIVRMKALARSFVWWSTLDNQIEEQVKQSPHGPRPNSLQSNEAEERAVQNIKAAIKRSLQDQPSSFQNLQHIIDNYLMVYRNTPHTVTERTPAEMFLGRRPTTRLSILQPNLTEHVEKKKAAATPALVRVKSYHEGEKVWVRSSLSTCLVRVNEFTRFVYVDYLKPRSTSELPQMGTNSNPAVNINPPSSQGSVVQPEDKTASDVQREPPPQCDMKTTMSDVQPPPLPLTNSEPTQESLRRSTRVRKRS